MINNINEANTGGYLYINQSQYGSTYISPNSNNPLQGMLRMNGSNMEVYDGSTWLHVGGTHATISLNQTAVSALDWCQRKMTEEAKIKELAANNPTIADAFEAYNEAKSKLEVVLTLTDNQ